MRFDQDIVYDFTGDVPATGRQHAAAMTSSEYMR